jgi:hypothetical protein
MKKVYRIFGRMKAIWLFLSIALFYSAWMTGFSFKYSECKMFPNYNILAEAFMSGRLDLDSDLRTDTSVKDGKKYLYAGLRAPFLALLKPTAVTAAYTLVDWTAPSKSRVRRGSRSRWSPSITIDWDMAHILDTFGFHLRKSP